MKKMLCMMMVVLTLVLCACSCEEPNMMSATVCEVNAEAVAFEDANGDIWVWELEEGEVFELGQAVEIQFDDMGTADIYDDEIIQIIF